MMYKILIFLISVLVILIINAFYYASKYDTVKINGINIFCEGNKSYYYTNSEPIVSNIIIDDNNYSLNLIIRNYKEEKVFIDKNVCFK